MGSGLPTPPLEDQKPRKTSSSSKSIKPNRHTAKRASPHNATQHHDHASQGMSADGRHKRVWKACERCRMKKTKCDGEFPCKRCKDDGLVCTAGVRKKTEYKQLPRGYAEVLEHTQFALIATVHKLYSMVRNQQQWDLGEPELNDRGQPVIHNIAQKLGCIRPNSDIDLPVHSVFPEDEAGLTELARQLEEQQKERDIENAIKVEADSASSCERSDRASSSEIDHPEFEADYRKAVFGGHNNPMTMSPQSFSTGYTEFDVDSVPSPAGPTAAMFQQQNQSPPIDAYQQWNMPRQAAPPSMDLTQQFFQHPGALTNMDMLSQGLMESEFGTIKPHVLNCPNPEVMMGMGDPMIYGGYDGEPLRL
ncbi:Fluconazole resistance protein 1 [Colletotrichum tanaceti]|uniref:Fluconazole resistance protein 1 n=1 Tax=Colletotrichum tanaceti TaxID=1306861 RepID=A0A4U6XT49_9PEZI|nr:Fluconazole resistance protein 1 [Colletotrichum tanaceti]TKW59038.1 Fluconazole resistance protein 1 [Colletotrichum tanaceti]